MIKFIKKILGPKLPIPASLAVPKQCLDLIKQFEGLRLKPYLDGGGVPTIGYGNTYYLDGKPVTLLDKPISEDQANKLLESTALKFFKQVFELTKSVKLTPNQLSALTCFAYNTGIEALKTSTLLKLVLANPNDLSIRLQFQRWNKDNGKIVSGLVRRREAEANLYFS
jgi:lysozyme